MQSKWSDWLAAERAAGRGGIVLARPSIVRGQAFTLPFAIPGDLTGDAFEAALFNEPTMGLSPVASFTATLSAYDPATATTTLTLTLPASATDTELPPDSNLDGVSEVVFKLEYTPAGGTKTRAASLVIPITE